MKNEYTVTWELYRSWVTENMFRGVYLAMMLMWLALGIVLLVLAFLVSSVIYKILCIFMCLFCVYRGLFRNYVLVHTHYRHLAKMYGGENWIRTVEISDNCITLSEGNNSAEFLYSDIADISEKDNKIWLKTKKRTVIRLYKDAFVSGSWEECRALLEEKRSS